jgi:anti-sigma factor RsiW
MNCKKIRKLLSSYIDKEIDAKSGIEIEKHLLACDNCKNEYDILMNTKELLYSLTSVDLPSDFYENIQKEVSKRAKTLTSVEFLLDWFKVRKKEVLVVGLALLLFFAIFIIRNLQLSEKENISIDRLFLSHLTSLRNEPFCLNSNSATFVISSLKQKEDSSNFILVGNQETEDDEISE